MQAEVCTAMSDFDFQVLVSRDQERDTSSVTVKVLRDKNAGPVSG